MTADRADVDNPASHRLGLPVAVWRLLSTGLPSLALGAGAGFLSGALLAWWLARYEPLSQRDYQGLREAVAGEADLIHSLQPERLRRDTEALASIGNRRSGMSGEAEARQWVQDQFRAAGLSRVSLSPVVYPRWRRLKRSALTFFTPAPYAPDFIVLAGSAATAAAGLECQLIDAGQGSQLDYVLRAGRGLAGTAHLLFQTEEPRRDLVLRATRQGAAAVILANGRPSPRGKPLIQNGTAVHGGRIPVVAVSYETGQYLREQVARGRVAVLMHINVGYRPGLSFNVMAEIPGQRAEYVVLAAHYDAWYGGAADNAAGLACLLELARVWTASRLRPRRTIRFVSFAAEEDGLIGSLFEVVTRAAMVKARCRGVITPDVVGVPGGSLRLRSYPSSLAAISADLAVDLGYPQATGYPVSTSGAPVYADHWPYARLLLPALLVSKGPDPYYHTPFDSADRLDYEDVRWTAAVVGAMALRLAQR